VTRTVARLGGSREGLAGRWGVRGEARSRFVAHPVLIADGDLGVSAPLSFRLYNAAPQALGFLVFGLQTLEVPFKGGVLVPDPFGPGGSVLPVTADGVGRLDLATTWPGGLPAGLDIYAQYWAADPAGWEGYAASNAITQTTR